MTVDTRIIVAADVPRVDGASVSSTVTSAPFTAPAGSLVVACVAANSSPGGTTTAAMSNSGTALTWGTMSVANFATTGVSGYAGIFTAPCSTLRTGMTVTVTTAGSTSTTRRPSLKVYVLTGKSGVVPSVAVMPGAWATSNAFVANRWTSGLRGGLGIMACCEWTKAGVPTSRKLGGGFDQAGSDGVAGVIGQFPLGLSSGYHRYDLDAYGAALAAWNIATIFPYPDTTVTPAGFVPVPLPGSDTRVQVEAAFGADMTDSSGLSWDWTDITTDVHGDPGLSISTGRGDEATTSQPAAMTCSLDNTAGAYSAGPGGPNYPRVRQGVPIRVRCYPGGGGGYFRILFQGYAASWTPEWEVPGSPRRVRLEAAGYLRQAAQGVAPVESPLRRAFRTNPSTVGYWPCEDGEAATGLAQAIGLTAGSFTVGAKLGGGTTDAPSSESVVQLARSVLTFNVDAYAAVVSQMVQCLWKFPEAGTIADGTLLMQIFTTGTAAKWDLNYKVGGGIQLNVRDRFENIVYASGTVGFAMDEQTRLFDFAMTQNGADIGWTWGSLQPGLITLGSTSGTVTGHTMGVIRGVTVNATGLLDDVAFGHLAVLANDARRGALQRTLNAFAGDPACATTGGDDLYLPRQARLADEMGVPLVWQDSVFQTAVPSASSTPADRMGAQPMAVPVDLLREAEATEGGILFDGTNPGLTYVERRAIESRTPDLTLIATAAMLSPPFGPTADDQRLRNRITVTRVAGSSATVQDTTGPLGTRNVGLYDDAVTLSLYTDEGTTVEAGWLLSRGTVAGYRYPQVTLDLQAYPTLITSALMLRPGYLIEITNANAVLPFGPQSVIRLLVEGVRHTITAKGWTMELACSPYQVWRSGVLAADTGTTSPYVARSADEGTSTLASPASVGATSLSVATPADSPRWTTLADDFTPALLLDVGGYLVTCSAISGASSPQTFTVSALPAPVAAGAVVTLADVGQSVAGL